jgi:hypothetical protein
VEWRNGRERATLVVRARGEPELEVWAARRQADALARAVGREIDIEAR